MLFLSLMMVSCAFFSHYTIDAADTTPLPDLAVIHAQNTYDPICLGPCSQLVIMAIIENQGSVDAPPFDALLNGIPVHSDSLPAGQRTTLTAPMADSASPTISVIIDPDHAITESNENNNSLTTYTMTLTPPPPCAVGVCE